MLNQPAENNYTTEQNPDLSCFCQLKFTYTHTQSGDITNKHVGTPNRSEWIQKYSGINLEQKTTQPRHGHSITIHHES
jgi:hypothetical protein